MKIALVVYGCRVNQAEFQKLEKQLKYNGYELVNNLEEADYWIINTCAVTHKAEIQSKGIIKKGIKLNKKCIVTGCLTDLLTEKFNGNVIIFRNREKDNIIKYFKKITENNTLRSLARHRAIVKIQDGCNQKCSYCIVPYLRGVPKSYPLEEVLKEISEYESIGIKEIILSGINLGLYGIDSTNKINLKKLLKEILKKTSSCRIRLSSIEINHIDDELIEIVSDSRICKHLHIPLQSGSERILKLMNRPYRINDYVAIIDKILNKHPLISLGTDVIVGFPSETDIDFKETKNLIEKIDFSYLHVFSYSKRPFTEAAKMKEVVPESIKKARAQQLIEIGKRKKRSYIEKFIGLPVEIIVEQKKNSRWSGTSDNYIKCVFKEANLNPGMLIRGNLIETDGDIAFVKIVNREETLC